MASKLKPPACVRGMLTLDRSLFTKEIIVPTIRIKKELLDAARPTTKKYLLKLPNFKAIKSIDEESLVYFNPAFESFQHLQEEDKKTLERLGVSELRNETLSLTYDNYAAGEILKSILPIGESCASFSTIGHILHLNLREEILPYKHVIGSVLLDKIKNCRTVVNKAETLDEGNEYRNFSLELIAGERDFVTETSENGCKFNLDFSKVYWNPRLGAEHARIVSKLKSGDVLYDIFAGIGPFAVASGKKGCRVLANDLNSECALWLRANSEKNKVKAMEIYNLDAKDFIANVMKKDLLNSDSWLKQTKSYATMNLPSKASEFLREFSRLFDTRELDKISDDFLPIVHLYCFVKMADCPEEAGKLLVEASLGMDLGNDLREVFNVRKVAPNKDMIRVSFKLSKRILEGGKGKKRILDE